ncbi:MAG: hypothetical protein HYU66_02655 [Armatimonadetes bacterium]|nr:hypothetical protein [Armatimonadota bacterium]
MADYARRYAKRVHGVDDPTGELTLNALATPFPRQGPGAWIGDGYQATRLFWSDATELRRRWSRRQPRLVEEAEPAAQLAADAVARVDAYAAKATSNKDLFGYEQLAYRLVENGPRRLAALEGAAKHYDAALKPGADAPAELAAAGASVQGVADTLTGLHDDYDRAVLQLGAAESDLKGLARLAESYGKLAQRLDELATARRNDPTAALPSPETLGLELGKATLVGRWEPRQFHNEDVVELRYDLPAGVWQGGPLRIEWFYTSGAHALRIDSTQLLKGDQPVAEDQHAGITGASHNNNVYTLTVPEVDQAAKYTVVGRVHPWGGPDSGGEVWMLTDD